MKIRLFGIFLAVCFLAVGAHAQTTPAKNVKHAATKVQNHAMFKLVVKAPFTGLKGIGYSVLFTGETIVDGARVVLTGADTVFDVLSLQGKLPVLDSIYAGIGIASKDAAWADTHVENWEQDIFGRHN